MTKDGYDSKRIRAENLRAGSLARGHGLSYLHGIEELGIDIEDSEDPYLAEMGLADLEFQKRGGLEKGIVKSPVPRTVKESNYRKFYGFGNEIYGRQDNRAVDEKRRLLAEHFPRAFGNNGKNCSFDMTFGEVNTIFDTLIESTKKKYNL
jgi:hypothetical protein